MKETARLKDAVARYYEDKLETEFKTVPVCYHPGGIETTDRTIKEAGIGDGSLVLDVASGPGDTAIYLVTSLGSNVIGIDLSRKMVNYANSLVKTIDVSSQVRFLVTDAEKLPFKDNIFDAVISECSLCLVPNMLGALSEIKRVLKPGSKVVVSDVVLMENLSGLKDFLSYANCIAGARTLDEYIKEFKRAGFTGIKTTDLSHHVTKQIRCFLENQGINPEEIVGMGEFLLSESKMDMETFQKISFHLWLSGKIGYSLVSGVKPKDT